MGKTKTLLVEGQVEVKSGVDKYKEKKAKQAATQTTDRPSFAKASKGVRGSKVRSQKYVESKAKVQAGKSHSVKDAIKLVKDLSYSKFDGTVELHLTVKKTGTNLQVTLPHAAGKTKRIEIASDETLKKIQDNKIDFDILLATADMMPKLVAFAKVLGPKGLMPNPKNGTIIKSPKDAEKFSGNTLQLKTEKEAPLIHTVVGKVSQKESELEDNIETIFKALNKDKGLVRAFLKATMSPSVKLAI